MSHLGTLLTCPLKMVSYWGQSHTKVITVFDKGVVNDRHKATHLCLRTFDKSPNAFLAMDPLLLPAICRAGELMLSRPHRSREVG